MQYSIEYSCSQAQEQWSELYLAMARPLVEKYEVHGKSVIREGVRKYAASMAHLRKEELLRTGNKTNLETIFANGFGFPCGERALKEWIKYSEQELFVNIIACPYADYWAEQKAQELGRMFCEEYYPVLIHEAASEKAQINLGSTLMNGFDDYCRLSVYLRPANLPPKQRAQCFPAFDTSGEQPIDKPSYIPDFGLQKKLLYDAFVQAGQEKLGNDCASLIRDAARDYVDICEGEAVTANIHGRCTQ